jgi:hypothetical protein
LRTVAGERRAASRDDPRLHVGVRDVDELHSGPLRENVLAQDVGIALVRGRLWMRLTVKPTRRPIPDCDLAAIGST